MATDLMGEYEEYREWSKRNKTECTQHQQYSEYENLGELDGLDEIHLPRASEKQVGGEHYKDMRIQPTTFIEQNKLGWCEGNAVKYICRHKVKGNIKDIEKAIHYLDLLLEQEYSYVRTENLTA